MKGYLSVGRITWLRLLAFALVSAPVLAADQPNLWASLGLPPGGDATRIAMDAATPALQFLLVPDQGIYRSTDTGGHWSLVQSSASLLDMAMDPQQPNTLYIVNTHNVVSKSSDGGTTWSDTSTGLPHTVDGGSEAHLTVDPVDEGTVYLVTWGQGVYKSIDGGTHWNAINTGIDSASSTNLLQAGAGIHSLTVDPANPQVLYLAAWSGRDVITGLPGMGIAGIYQSVDGGVHWSQILSGESTWALGVQPGNDQDLFVAGTYYYYSSTDGGAHWSHTGFGPTFSTEFLFDPTNPLHVWVASNVEGGMAVSVDGGATWNVPNGDDGSTAGVMDLAVDPTGSKLYAAWRGTAAGTSSDDGSTWQFSNNGIEDGKVTQVVVGGDGTIYLGTKSSGLYRSSDGGKTWMSSDAGIVSPLATEVEQMVEDPSDSSIYATIGGQLYKSIDHGASWSGYPIPLSGGFGPLALTAGQPSTIYAAQMNGVEKSTDGGASWHLMNTGLPMAAGHMVEALASDPKDAQKVFAGTSRDGLYVSEDGAAHWTQVAGLVIPSSSGTASVFGLAIDPSDPDIVYATIATGVMKSTDGGVTWSDSSSGLESNDLLGLITVDPADSQILVARSQIFDNVYMSIDGGAQWTLVSGATSVRTSGVNTTSTAKIPKLTALSMDPKHKGMMYGADASGGLDAFDLAQLASVLKQTAGGGSAGGSSGGGGFPLLMSLLLLGFAARRRRK